ncbi:AraC family transcriptional regulator [Paenibacillus sp. NEAU-GSW1]|uniref:helix-turn-helix domain-containing protein n=1 Tax=Paenibacillus sp. NEAU-GSW1 TaxID=2682486 RepID=UPI0012E21B25|nr:AraC family transcriptional regulator [Paenibacillus sp. NEAU-GSW1]MUT67424.1 helix-turn-helix domain-containing protein [Paenibacillus sp. NEAU-GSW1]
MWKLPTGERHSREAYMLPNMEATVSLHYAHMRTVEPNWSYPVHYHSLFEINWVLAGKQLMHVNGMPIAQETGDILLIRSGERHRSEVQGGEEMSYFCLHFDIGEARFRRRMQHTNTVVFPQGSGIARKLYEPLGKLLEMTRTIPQAADPNSHIRVLSALFELCSVLGDALEEEGTAADTPSSSRLPVAREMARMLEEAAENAASASEPAVLDDAGGEGRTVERIAGRLGFSTAYCNRLFHEAFGLSPRQYLSQVKLQLAKRWLLDLSISVSDIALRLGYRDIAHFSRQFKRWSGVSPSDYRKSLM